MGTGAAYNSGKRDKFFWKKRKDDLAVIVSVGTVAVILQVGGCLLRGFGHEGEALENDVQGLGTVQTNIYLFYFFDKNFKGKEISEGFARVQAKKDLCFDWEHFFTFFEKNWKRKTYEYICKF